MWTLFWDMHSGGGLKEKWSHIYIEAPEHMAKLIFYNRFGHNPERVSCTCCGEDYSISSEEDLVQLTAFHRNCAFNKGTDQYEEKSNGYRDVIKMKEYLESDEVKFIRAEEIGDVDMEGSVPTQGYKWID